MKITLEPTATFREVNGLKTRIWKGQTDKGVPLVAYVAVVQVHKDADNAAFVRELQEVTADARPVATAFDLRFFID